MCMGRVSEITSIIAHINEQFRNFPQITHAQHIADYQGIINRDLLELQQIMDKYKDDFFSDSPVHITRRSLVFCLKNLIINSVNSKYYRYITDEQLALCTFTEDTFLSLFAENLIIPKLPRHPPDPGTPPGEANGPKKVNHFFDGDHEPFGDGGFQYNEHDKDNVDWARHPILPVDRERVQNAEPRGSERDVSSAMQYHTIILENIHRRLSALELRMGV